MLFRESMLELPRCQRLEPMMEALGTLFIAEQRMEPTTCDPDTPFAKSKAESSEPVALHQIVEPWVTGPHGLGLGAFFDYELEGIENIRQLAEYLAAEIEPPPTPTETLRGNYPSTICGLSPAEPYSGTDRVVEATAFILGSPRSGTTLLRSMLDGHPLIDAPPELHILQLDTMADWQEFPSGERRHWIQHGLCQALRRKLKLSEPESYALADQLADRDISIPRIYRLLHGRNGARWLVDKSPGYARHVDWLRRAEQMFVEPRYLHLLRHPCAVIASLVRMRLSKLLQDVESLEQMNPWLAAEAMWLRYNENILEFESEVPSDRWHRVTYEEMVTHPERAQRAISEFLGVEFHDAVLDPYQGDRLPTGVGDLNFRKRHRIEPQLAEAWRDEPLPFELSERTRNLATRLGYDLE